MFDYLLIYTYLADDFKSHLRPVNSTSVVVDDSWWELRETVAALFFKLDLNDLKRGEERKGKRF